MKVIRLNGRLIILLLWLIMVLLLNTWLSLLFAI
nr:MAG TPA: hypothetical protein [Crassvirales sp.]